MYKSTLLASNIDEEEYHNEDESNEGDEYIFLDDAHDVLQDMDMIDESKEVNHEKK